MKCFYPMTAYQCEDKSIVFDEAKGPVVRTLLLSCGQCIGCRLKLSMDWALRCVHESQLHKENCYITLTYAGKGSLHDGCSCVEDGWSDHPMSLCYRDFQLFMKRLRKAISDKDIRFYMCGEYGEQFSRPHFHACLFGYRFEDLRSWSKSSSGFKLYRSKILELLWTHGNSTVGDVTFESAAYVARYLCQKITGSMVIDPGTLHRVYSPSVARAHYQIVDEETGEVVQRRPEFNKMSLKPGIGSAWLDKFFGDVYPEGRAVARGVKVQPPRYYDEKFRVLDPDGHALMAFGRHLESKLHFADNTESRVRVKEKVAVARGKLLKRNIS